MSIFPFMDPQVVESTSSTKELPIPKEYAWDFETGDFLLADGKFIVLQGLEAIEVWIYKALVTERYRYLIYSWNFGSELDTLVGSTYSRAVTQSEAERFIKECLLVNPYITEVKNIKIHFSDDTLAASFTAVTQYGEVSVNV